MKNSIKFFYIFFLLSTNFYLPVLAYSQGQPSVIVTEAKEQDWYDSIKAIGTLKANEEVVLTASVTDIISKIHFDDGQRVEEGYILAEMIGDEESALVNEMKARSKEAKSQFDRLKNLPKSGAVSESLYDQREREYQSAKALLQATQSRLRDRLVIAPFSGVIGLRNISVGALVSPGDEIARLTDDSLMKLDFAVPALFLNSLSTGLTIISETSAYPGKSFEGKIASIDSRVNDVTRSIMVRVAIDNQEKLLKPGLLMTIYLQYNSRKAIILPEETLIPVGDKNFVYLVDRKSKVVTKKEVEIGTRKTGKVEIISGVKLGEQVITHGVMVAKPGEAVSIKAIDDKTKSIKEILEKK